jgi:hypothetical protein
LVVEKAVAGVGEALSVTVAWRVCEPRAKAPRFTVHVLDEELVVHTGMESL